jgi:ribonucleotide reductase alpha subunit
MTSPSVPSFIPQLETEMNVTKRNGDLETVSFDKILKRMKRQGPEIKVNYTALAMKVIDQLYDGISTTKIDELSAEQCASMASVHPDYNTLAGRIIVSSHQKNTQESFTTVMTELYEFKDKNGEQSPLVSDELMAIILENPHIDNLCDYSRDFLVDYFGFKTLDRAYLMKIGGKAVERPQHMWLRVAIGIHGFDLAKVKETYDLMSQKYFTHATPTLFNAGTPRPQLSSCFLNAMESDSIDGIYNTLKECALISKHAGGIGLHIHNIRATGSHIRGTNGTSNGIVPMLRVFNNTAKYVDQCLTPETIILSSNGPMRIDQIVPGVTAVYNMTGETEVVQNVLQHYQQDEIFEIINVGSSPNVMTVTGAHQIYVLRGYVDQSETVIKNDLDLRIAQFEWVEAKDLTTNDFLVFSVPKGEQDFSELTSDVCYVYGLLLSGITIVIENNIQTTQTTENIEYIENFLTSNSIQYEIVSEDGLTIQWPISPNLPFLSSDFYTMMNISSFRMSKRWIFLPREKTTRLLDGLGNFQPLYVDMFFLNLRLGHIYDYENNKQEVDINYGDFLIVPIKSVRKTTYWGVVFDLQMTTEHNYLTQQGIVHNGGGKRNGSFAIYLEPWHADIEMFLQMRKNHGDEELKARDLFYALWIPDLFMERVKTNGTWTLMCPDECPGLADVYGPAFKELYEKYEQEGKGRSTVQARELWFKVLDAQMETGTPYLCYKDAANQKSNQKNVGVIKSSNLCVAPETVILHKDGESVIKDLCDKEVDVWNGVHWSPVIVRKTGEDQPLVKVVFDNGRSIECTPYHKFYVMGEPEQHCHTLSHSDKDCHNKSVVRIDARDLVPGMELEPFVLPMGTEIHMVKVVEVVDHGRRADTYCFTELSRGRGVFNGILTGQCSEIMEYSDANETAVCNLASIGLPTYIRNEGDKKVFDYEKLHEVAKVVTKNLNKIIDVNYYPTEKTRKSNMRHRPIGIGIQGLADVFLLLGHAFLSEEARQINRDIFETIYHGALEASCELAAIEGPYETWAGCPASEGKLQFDLWGVQPSGRYDWAGLKEVIKTKGLRNSLLLAPMPTASTSQILGFNECIEPITSNIYSRRTIAGEFIQVNRYLIEELIGLGIWNEKVKNNIIANHGSIQQLDFISQEVKDKYKTVWEMPMRGLIDMAADRGAFNCQSQSLNLWLEDPNYNTLTAMHFYAWQKGLKTGMYYLRRRGKHQAQQFTIEPEKAQHVGSSYEEEICELCSA